MRDSSRPRTLGDMTESDKDYVGWEELESLVERLAAKIGIDLQAL